MKQERLLLLCGALLLASPSVASADGRLNNAWDTCYADGGALLRTSACSSNSNAVAFANVAVQSVLLDAPMPAYQGNVCFIDVITLGSSLPSWWSCPGKLTPFSAVSGISPCVNDAYANSGGGHGILAATTVGFSGPNTVQGIYSIANNAGSETDLAAGREYFMGSITISNAKTTGTGACDGCTVPACISFAQCNMDHLVNGVSFQDVVRAGGDQPWVHWQTNSVSCIGIVDPTRNSTWGAIKSLYR